MLNMGGRGNIKSSMFKRLILAIFISLLFFQQANSTEALEGFIKFVSKKGAIVFLELAITSEEQTKGLMDRPLLEKNRGMVFVFRPEKKVTFTMKNTLIPLDIIFINRGKIVKIVRNAESNQTHTLYPSEEIVSEVVEVNGGYATRHGIKLGDKIKFKNIAQIDYSK